jgi:predicted nucleic acid-binding protein
VPEILFHEELASRHAHLIEMGLQLRAMSGEQMQRADAMMVRHRGPSSNDILALALAADLKCPLVTGDARLRAAAQAEGVELLGTLVLIEQLISREQISVEAARAAYDAMRAAGRRLPWDEVDRQLKRLLAIRARVP